MHSRKLSVIDLPLSIFLTGYRIDADLVSARIEGLIHYIGGCSKRGLMVVLPVKHKRRQREHTVD